MMTPKLKSALKSLLRLFPHYRMMDNILKNQLYMCERLSLFEEQSRLRHESAIAQQQQIGSASFKNEIEIRYQIMDALDGRLFPPETKVGCGICGHSAPKHTFETLVSHCIFGGGRLERFICPVCGVIFGPLKMSSLDERQLGAEYVQSYRAYSESSETGVLEQAAFLKLNPVKDGVYLNYGAGGWNGASQKLRDDGYTIYDYEPYAPAEGNEYLIRSWEQLARLKFDGIYSNDLIEHLPDPAESLRRMKSLLKEGGIMSHGSGCYEYAFEYTRFHLFFFVGRSLDYMAERAGLNYQLGERECPELSPFRHCVFTPKTAA
jgi:SAM-dependent methyltransferase